MGEERTDQSHFTTRRSFSFPGLPHCPFACLLQSTQTPWSPHKAAYVCMLWHSVLGCWSEQPLATQAS